MIDTKDDFHLQPMLLRVMIGAKDDQSYCCDQDGVVDDKKMEDYL